VTRISRRTFVQAAAAPMVIAARPQAPRSEVTAQVLVDRLRGALGVPWREKTVDGFKAGDPATVLTGVAVTVAARLDVLRAAVAAKCNLVITQEPVFYGANDAPGNRAIDPVYLAKKAYIEQAGLVVWRFTDHWGARQPSLEGALGAPERAQGPDPRVVALAEALEWTWRPGSDARNIYVIPDAPLSAVVAHVRRRLGIRGGLRTVGPPDLPVRTVLISPGTTELATTVAQLKNVDVVLAGEPREWEVVPYILDAREAGGAKGLIAIGRIVSEEPGMRACAAWIRKLAPGLRVEALPVADPFWNPAS
jgi:hypothetical protein